MLEQIKAQLDRLVPVHGVSDLTARGRYVERELALVKVAGTGESGSRPCASPTSSAPAWSIPATTHFVFEMTGTHRQARRLHRPDAPLGLVDVSRTGVVAIARGAEGLLGKAAEGELSVRRRRAADGANRRHNEKHIQTVEEEGVTDHACLLRP